MHFLFKHKVCSKQSKLITLASYLNAAVSIIIAGISFNAYTAEPVPVRENKLNIGIGVTHNSMNYVAMDSLTDAVPIFDIQLGPFFAYNHHDEPFVGLELFRHKRVMLAIAATQGRQFLDVSEASDDKKWLFFGIEDRDKATEAGFIFKFFSRVGLVEMMTLRDISNTYDGFRSFISWSRPFPETGNWTIVPRMFGKYYSEDYNNFYYGISEEEMEAGFKQVQIEGIPGRTGSITEADFEALRPEHQAGNGGNFGLDLTVKYHFTENLSAQGYLGWEQLSGHVTSSILVEDADIWTLNAGIAYQF